MSPVLYADIMPDVRSAVDQWPMSSTLKQRLETIKPYKPPFKSYDPYSREFVNSIIRIMCIEYQGFELELDSYMAVMGYDEWSALLSLRNRSSWAAEIVNQPRTFDKAIYGILIACNYYIFTNEDNDNGIIYGGRTYYAHGLESRLPIGGQPDEN